MKTKSWILLGLVCLGIFGGLIYTGYITLPQDWNLPGEGDYLNILSYSKDAYSEADQDIIWVMYDMNGVYIDTATASSGKCTWGTMLKEGDQIQIQGRANDPSDAVDPYLTPVYTVTVPGGGDADTVSLGTFPVYDASTAVTFACSDQGGASISDNSANYFNTTDTAMIVTLTGCVADDVFGQPGGIVKDLKTGNWYGGMYVVWKGTVEQNFAAAFRLDDPSNIYYIWRIDMIVNDADVVDDGFAVYQYALTTGAMAADATVILDIYDNARCKPGGEPYIGTIASSDIDVTAITTKVA